MKKLKNTKTSTAGITLIALVITIVVLLILAGVSISMILGDNGILTKAKTAENETRIGAIKEALNTAGLEKRMEALTENTSKDIDAILLDLKSKDIISETEETEAKEKGTITIGKTIIDVKKELGLYTAYEVGDTVTLGEGEEAENFIVIKTSGEMEENVTLIAEKNIDVVTLNQSDSAGIIAFSSMYYWKNEKKYPINLNNYESESIVSTDAIEYAKAYGKKYGEDVEGRLMIVEEFFELTGMTASGIMPSELPSWLATTNYWLGSGSDIPSNVWSVYGTNKGLYRYDYQNNEIFGVRPVIEISKSEIKE